ncbi:MAG TPA: TonB-dependent receptor plug domain-containing protein [Longimicrobiales bacterium]
MFSKGSVAAIVAGASIYVLGGCGPKGLPPAGPAPGEVEIGYGAQPKEDVTGAVTSVSEEEIANSRPMRLDELLRGRVPGLEIIPRGDGGYTFRIRGIDSLEMSQEPLVIVDGVPIPTDGLDTALAGLTPDDIRQVDVLRDVSATSIYGPRGAGGVIIITTRR